MIEINIVQLKRDRIQSRFVSAGLLGASLALINALASVSELQRGVSWFLALAAFTIALPILVMHIILYAVFAPFEKEVNSVCLSVVLNLAYFLTLGGFAAGFWHLAWWIGLLFSGSSLAATGLLGIHIFHAAKQLEIDEFQASKGTNGDLAETDT